MLANGIDRTSIDCGGGAWATLMQIIDKWGFIRIGPDWLSGLRIQAINGFLASAFLAIVTHGEKASIGHHNGREANSHFGFPLQIIEFVPEVRLRGDAVLCGTQPIWPVSRKKG